MNDHDDSDGPAPRNLAQPGLARSIGGGQVPGLPGVPAFELLSPDPSAIPVLIAVPHAGRAYPPALTERMRNPGFAALRLEDRYVDRLGRLVAQATGATLLVANAPRAMIDLNRASDDVDWEMFPRGVNAGAGQDRAHDGGQGARVPGRRARTGLGLIPRRLPGMGELWKRRHEAVELDERIALVHAPYHERLAGALRALRERWGAALLVDLHSMPPLGSRDGQQPAQFVVGDRFGATCHGALVAAAFTWLAQCGRPAAHNRPYAGGYVLERHGAPRNGIHALQLEIDRSCYLDARLAEPGQGLEATAEVVAGLVRRLAADVAELGRAGRGGRRGGWAEAAE